MSQPQNIFSLSYTGVRAQRPPNIITRSSNPLPINSKNVTIGDLWINPSSGAPNLAKVWILLGLADGIANWVEFASSGGDILTINNQSPVAGNFNINTINTTVMFNSSLGVSTLDFGLDNILLGTSGSISSGLRNNALGFAALEADSSGSDNTAIGYQSLLSNTTGNENTAVGSLSANILVSGSQNTVLGYGAYAGSTNANGNIAIGVTALSGSVVSPATNNTAIGNESMLVSTTATENTAVGGNTLSSLTTGQLNLALGMNAGSAYDSTESSNIVLGNVGTIADAHTIRIGTQGSGAGQQNECFIAGIINVTVPNAAATVVVDTVTGQLGVGAGGSGPIETLKGNTGLAVGPVAGLINIIGDGTSITVAGDPATHTLTISALPGGGTPLIVTPFNYTGAPQNWTPNVNSKSVLIYIWNGGGGGGSGRQGASTNAGGGSGGSAGGATYWFGPASAFASPTTIIVGAGGTGGAAQASANTDGSVGTSGDISSVGTLTPFVVASGGSAGINGSATPPNHGIISTTNFSVYSQFGGSSAGQGNLINNGAISANVSMAGMSAISSTSGGGGGGADSGNIWTGGNAGNITSLDSVTIELAGGIGGSEAAVINGTSGNTGLLVGGFYSGGTGGGGGGGQSVGMAAGNGGNGGVPGSGGGGGGGSLNGTNSGSGGNGGNGAVLIIEFV